jgi:hypothetical protein
VRVRGCREMVASPEEDERPPLEAVTEQRD